MPVTVSDTAHFATAFLPWLCDVAVAHPFPLPCHFQNKYPPAKPEVLRLLAPQRGLTAIAKSKPKTEKTTNGRLPELSNNWLRVLVTAERSQIHQGVCHQLHPVVPLLDTFKS